MPKPKAKSYKHETQVAKLFSAWWGSEFKRTPNSGALRWQGVSWTYSDVLPPDGCPIALECKIRKEVDIWACLRPGANLQEHHPISWWNQSCADSMRCYEETGQVIHPLLVFREDRKKNYLCLEAGLYVGLYDELTRSGIFWVSHPEAMARFVIIDLNEFLASVTPDQFLEAQRKVVPQNLTQVVA